MLHHAETKKKLKFSKICDKFRLETNEKASDD